MDVEQLQINSDYENINLVEKFIVDICDKLKIEEDNFGNILIAVTEAVNNAIQHGNGSDPNKQIDLSCETTNKTVLFTIRDEGNGFDYTNVPDPTDEENIEKPNGRGVFIMRHLADDVDFLENGRTVKLHFKLAS